LTAPERADPFDIGDANRTRQAAVAFGFRPAFFRGCASSCDRPSLAVRSSRR
jgi:hypothetical protein